MYRFFYLCVNERKVFSYEFHKKQLCFFLPLFLVAEKDDTDEEEVISVDMPPEFYFIY